MSLSAWNDFTAGVKPYGVNYVLIVKYLPQCQKKMSLQNQVIQTIVAVNLSHSQVALPPLWIREPQYILNSQDIKKFAYTGYSRIHLGSLWPSSNREFLKQLGASGVFWTQPWKLTFHEPPKLQKCSCKNQVLQTIVAENLSYSHFALPPLPIRNQNTS